MKLAISVGLAVLFLGLLACIPSHLKKYRTRNPSATSSKSTPAADVQPRVQLVKKQPVKDRGRPPSIYAIDGKTFRFALGSKEIWDAALSVLLRNYNVTIVDKESGIITTEWDTFYLNKKILRNKISLRIQRNSRSSSDVMVHNSVEQLQSASPAGAVGAIWLPAEDEGKEVKRLISNMAILLNQPPPFVPPGNMALSIPTPP